MNGLVSRLPRLVDIHTERISLGQSFESIARRFAGDPGTVVLMSGTRLDCARYHILAVDPWLSIRSRQDRFDAVVAGESCCGRSDPLDWLDALCHHFSMPGAHHLSPVSAGLFGYFAYDLKDRIEILPQTCLGPDLPDVCLYAPAVILVQDRQNGRFTLALPEFESGKGKDCYCLQDRKQAFYDRMASDMPTGSYRAGSSPLRSSLSRFDYLAAVEQIIAYLKAGDIYQANLSQQFSADFEGDPFTLFLDLFKKNPAPFFSFVNAGDHTVVSTSPERFICQSGQTVETRPIKGTIARGRTPEKDRDNAQKLQDSIKDDAELTMIVDLMRNDLSRVTRPDSVVVEEHKRLEAYDNVFHLVSVVKGELAPGRTAVDLLRATFPGGSITGCPKIRSMEIIDELEPVRRHVYTGAIGYISFHETLDLSIAIRTATIADGTIRFSVGGGIVYDSDPATEYQETLDKGKTLMEMLGRLDREGRPGNPETVWLNGRLVTADRARLPVLSRGVQYGAGLFETIRVDQGIVHRLARHLQRMEHSWAQVFETPVFPSLSWPVLIDCLIRENRLETATAAVKIMALADESAPGGVSLAVTARPYIHRLDRIGSPGLDLMTCPHPRMTHLADHKTLNYLLYDLAGETARKNGAHEALILNPDSTVSETNTCSMLLVDRETVRVPASDHVLPGVTVSAVLSLLKEQGYDVIREPVTVADLTDGSAVLLTNALMGVVPVLSVNGLALAAAEAPETDRLCQWLNACLMPTDDGHPAFNLTK